MAVAAVMLRGPPAQPPIPDGGQPETNPSALRKSDLVAHLRPVGDFGFRRPHFAASLPSSAR